MLNERRKADGVCYDRDDGNDVGTGHVNDWKVVGLTERL